MKHFHHYHDNLPPRYKERYELFERRWNYYKKRNEEKKDRFVEELEWFKKFCKKYFLTPNLIRYLNNWLKKSNLLKEEIKIDLTQLYYFDNYFDKFEKSSKIEHGWSHRYEIHELRKEYNVIESEKYLKTIEKLLLYPNYYLNTLFGIYKKYTAHPLNKFYIQKCQKMALLSQKLIKMTFSESSFDVNQWKEYMKELDNDEIRIYTVEFYLSKPPLCNVMFCMKKAVWKYYIRLLKENNHYNKMLNTFSKYCRLFIEDCKMIERYRSEIEQICLTASMPVSKWWIDTIKFETHFGTLKSSYLILERALKSVFKKPFKLIRRSTKDFCKTYKLYTKKIIKSEKAKFAVSSKEIVLEQFDSNNHPATELPKLKPLKISFTNRITQVFALPEPTVYYIMKNADPLKLQKLFESCKHFFYLQSTPICYRLMIQDKMPSKYFDQAIFFSCQDDIQKLQNFYVVNSLQCLDCRDRKFLSKIISKLYRCDAKYINIQNQDLTVAEFKFLTKKCKNLKHSGCNIINENGLKINV